MAVAKYNEIIPNRTDGFTPQPVLSRVKALQSDGTLITFRGNFGIRARYLSGKRPETEKNGEAKEDYRKYMSPPNSLDVTSGRTQLKFMEFTLCIIPPTDTLEEGVFGYDIVEYEHNNVKSCGYIVYDSNIFAYVIKHFNDNKFTFLYQTRIIKVIGNIYTDNELFQSLKLNNGVIPENVESDNKPIPNNKSKEETRANTQTATSKDKNEDMSDKIVEGKEVFTREKIEPVSPKKDSTNTNEPKVSSQDIPVVIHTNYICNSDNEHLKSGYGYVIKKGKKSQKSANKLKHTNVSNGYCQLVAMVVALRHIKQISDITIYVQNKDIQNVISSGQLEKLNKNGWIKEDKSEIQNKELWQEIFKHKCNHKSLTVKCELTQDSKDVALAISKLLI